MKRILTIITSACCILLCSCSEKTTEISLTETSSDYNPFANIELDDGEVLDANFGYGLCNPPDNNSFEYQDEMTLKFFIENAAQEVDFGLVLYVNGILQEYIFENEAESQTIAHIQVKQNERKEFSVTFSPVSAQGDDEFCLSYMIMFHPDFTPQSSKVSFGNNYRISSTSFPLKNVSADIAEKSTLKFNDTEKIKDDIKSEYYILDEDGNITSNSLIDTTSIKVEKIANSDNINDTEPNTLYKEDKVSLMLLGGHDNSSWRVSMYCNHKLVKAFDGNEYIDLKADSDEMSTYTIPMSVINDVPKQYNSIYFIASPIGSDGENYPIKSHTFVYVNK